MKILVGLSGGVDSAVSAYLLKQQGHDVSAGFMINYLTDDDSCPTRIDMEVAREVAAYLEIPFFTFDFIEEYEKRVLHYIFEGYKNGLTPNPDVFCNTWIKFDLFLQEAISYGYDAVATGHYARISEQEQRASSFAKATADKKSKEQSEGIFDDHNVNSLTENLPTCLPDRQAGQADGKLKTKNLKLLRGVDPEKDQSYFLSALRRDQLEKAIFPVGNIPKSEVREIARRAGLPNAERKDSQGLCFVGKVDFAEFLKSQIPVKKGPIVDATGKIIGEHEGAFQYTIGQRKGIAVGGGPALYVVEKNVTTNTLYVGTEDDPRLFRDSCALTQLNWLTKPVFPLECEAQIRYRQKPQRGTLNVKGGTLEMQFLESQRAITPGQVCALYDGDRVLGSGIIQF